MENRCLLLKPNTKQTPNKANMVVEVDVGDDECVTETHKNNWPPEFGCENDIQRNGPTHTKERSATEMEMEMKLSSVNVQPSQIKFVHVSKSHNVWYGICTQNTYHINLNHSHTHAHMLRRKVEMGKLGDSESSAECEGVVERNRC